MSSANVAAQGRLAGLAAKYANASTNANSLVATQKNVSGSVGLLDTVLKRGASGSGMLGAALDKLAEKSPKLARVIRVAIQVGAAFIATTRAVAHYGIEIGKASLSAFKMQQADRITYEGLLHSESAAMALDKRVTGLADTYGVATKDVGGWAATLIKAGVRGKELSSALHGLAIRQAATGDASEALQPLVDQLKAGSRSAAGFAKEQERLFGGAAIKRGQTFEAGIDRIKRRFGEMMASPAMAKGFDAVFGKIESFLQSPAAADFATKITGTVGKALERLPGFIDTASAALPKLAAGFDVAVSAATALLNVVSSVADVVSHPGETMIETMQRKSRDRIASGEPLTGDQTATLDKYRQQGQDAGAALAQGVASGISAKQSVATAAAAGMASSITAIMKSALEIHSPSRVFARLGAQTAEGFGQGIAANDTPARAVRAMVTAPAASPAPRGGRSVVVHIGSIVGVKDAGDAGELLEARIADALEAALLSSGAAA
ncbi:MAG: hypothetical protein HY908_02140 [Myxococcales bacterium]|nr:hypothetical protein [Myxococcales bacterium]